MKLQSDVCVVLGVEPRAIGYLGATLPALQYS